MTLRSYQVLCQTCSEKARSVCGRHLAESPLMPEALFLDRAECSGQRGVRSPWRSRAHRMGARTEPQTMAGGRGPGRLMATRSCSALDSTIYGSEQNSRLATVTAKLDTPKTWCWARPGPC